MKRYFRNGNYTDSKFPKRPPLKTNSCKIRELLRFGVKFSIRTISALSFFVLLSANHFKESFEYKITTRYFESSKVILYKRYSKVCFGVNLLKFCH